MSSLARRNESKYHLAAVRVNFTAVCRTITVILFIFKKDNFQCLHINGCSYIQMSDRDC